MGGGLVRWDGTTATNFLHQPDDSTSIAGNYIAHHGLFWDSRRGVLYVGGSGFNIFDPLAGKFKRYAHREGDASSLPHNSVYAVYKDKQGQIWLGTRKGLCRFFPEKDSFHLWPLEKSGIPLEAREHFVEVATCISIQEDLLNDSILWTGHGRGLVKWNKFSGKYQYFEFAHKDKQYQRWQNIFRGIYAHENGKLYLATWMAGMVVFDTPTGRFVQNIRRDGLSYLAGEEFMSPYLIKKSDEEFWQHIRGFGMEYFHIPKGVFQTYNDNIVYAGRTPILYNISAIDNAERIWASSLHGALVFNPAEKLFENRFFKEHNPINYYLPRWLHEDTAHQVLYLAFQAGDGLHFFDLKNDTFGHYPFPRPYRRKSESVWQLYPKGEDGLLVATNKNLFQFNKKNRSFARLPFTSQTQISVGTFAKDSTGQYWMTSSEKGLLKVDFSTFSWQPIGDWEAIKRVEQPPHFSEIHIDKNNNLWITRGYDDGLVLFDNETQKLHWVAAEDGSTLNVGKISPAPGGNLYTVENARIGIGIINPDEPEKGVQPVPAFKNLSKGHISSFEFDKKNRLWVVYGNHIEMLDPTTGQTRRFTEAHGLRLFDERSQRSPLEMADLYLLSSGRMVIHCRQGLAFFHPDSLLAFEDNELPRPYIHKITVNGEAIDWPVVFEKTPPLKLPHTANDLLIGYSALGYNNADKYRFFHQLEGAEEEWKASGNRSASYINLRPGSYIFKVKNTDARWAFFRAAL